MKDYNSILSELSKLFDIRYSERYILSIDEYAKCIDKTFKETIREWSDKDTDNLTQILCKNDIFNRTLGFYSNEQVTDHHIKVINIVTDDLREFSNTVVGKYIIDNLTDDNKDLKNVFDNVKMYVKQSNEQKWKHISI